MNMYSNSREEMTRHWETSLTVGLTEEEARVFDMRARTDSVIATAEYGAPLTAAVARGNVYGCQFHPEKSGNVGLSIIKAFSEL